jgi:hypothetical protein
MRYRSGPPGPGPDPCGPSAARGTVSLASGLERQVSTYGAPVRDSDEIDADEWARLLGHLLRTADLTPESAAPVLGVAARTIRKWLNREGASAIKVRDVARARGYSAVRALVEVRFLEASEVGVAGLAGPPAPSDPELRKIAKVLENTDIPEDARRALRAGLRLAFEGWTKTWTRPPHEPPAMERVVAPTRQAD